MTAPGLSEAQVNALYQQYLGRAPEAGVAAQWAAAGGAKESDLANALGTSQEFGMRAMADPTRTFVPGNPNAPAGATFQAPTPAAPPSPMQPTQMPGQMPMQPGMGGMNMASWSLPGINAGPGAKGAGYNVPMGQPMQMQPQTTPTSAYGTYQPWSFGGSGQQSAGRQFTQAPAGGKGGARGRSLFF